MNQVLVTLGMQEILCKGELCGQVYKGLLTSPIIEKETLEFWSAYEDAVDKTMLSEVEVLENKMHQYNFHVSFDGNRFLGADVDLQIYPSCMAMSFSIPD
jgi:hypothetical protein